jgi:hypothetical protein
MTYAASTNYMKFEIHQRLLPHRPFKVSIGTSRIFRLICGFCSKEESEAKLSPMPRPAMLLRFSDMLHGHLKLSCKLPDHRGPYPWIRVSNQCTVTRSFQSCTTRPRRTKCPRARRSPTRSAATPPSPRSSLSTLIRFACLAPHTTVTHTAYLPIVAWRQGERGC